MFKPENTLVSPVIRAFVLGLLLTALLTACTTTESGQRNQRDMFQMSALVGGELQGLRDEVAALRESIDAMNARLDAMGAPPAPEPPVVRGPGTNGDAPDEPVGSPRTITFGPTEKDSEEGETLEAPPIQIVSEYGRDLETAAEFDASSLKGITAYVPAGTPRAALERLGRDLRNQFDAYDNIAIDIFDDEEAARSYADSPTANAAHRVLKIMKYQDTGKDEGVVYHEGRALPIY